MKSILKLSYPFGHWAFGLTKADKIVQWKDDKYDGTRTELWFEFRFPFEHTSHFHRLKIKV